MEAENPYLTLTLGGARSGKSLFAETKLKAFSAPYVYIATAEPFDEEMRRRIEEHKARRGGEWRAIEAPHELARALAQAPPDRPLLVDCLTLWLTNRLLAGADAEAESIEIAKILSRRPAPAFVVSNEVGLGGVSENALSRKFCDAAGRLNQKIARIAGSVYFIAAGLPLRLK